MKKNAATSHRDLEPAIVSCCCVFLRFSRPAWRMGPPGAPNVAWGEWAPFIAYTGKLLWFLPASWVPVFGAVATASEIALGLWLLLGLRLQTAALASAGLLLTFAATMTAALGIKAPLDYSVFTGVAAALALAALANNARHGHRQE